jgi:hypothetical protein
MRGLSVFREILNSSVLVRIIPRYHHTNPHINPLILPGSKLSITLLYVRGKYLRKWKAIDWVKGKQQRTYRRTGGDDGQANFPCVLTWACRAVGAKDGRGKDSSFSWVGCWWTLLFSGSLRNTLHVRALASALAYMRTVPGRVL